MTVCPGESLASDSVIVAGVGTACTFSTKAATPAIEVGDDFECDGIAAVEVMAAKKLAGSGTGDSLRGGWMAGLVGEKELAGPKDDVALCDLATGDLCKPPWVGKGPLT